MNRVTMFVWHCLFFLGMASGVAQGVIIVNAGPEIYNFERQKEGGTRQSGALEGGRFIVERMVPYGIYMGLEAFWGGGNIEGYSASGRKLVSNITDYTVEGRLGYTLISGCAAQSIFTAYAGYGYFHEINSFENPSPILYTSTDTFNYGLVGFLSGHNFTSLLSIGLNFEVKFMLDGKSKVTDDPDFDDITLKMTNEIQTRLEVPLIYRFSSFYNLFQCTCPGMWEAQLVPFYEYRHFGGREDFPFDFIDTKFNLFGIRASIGIRF